MDAENASIVMQLKAEIEHLQRDNLKHEAALAEDHLTIERLTAELAAAKATIVRATELADDLYSYAIDQWRWKYGEYWDAELTAIRDALTDKQAVPINAGFEVRKK